MPVGVGSPATEPSGPGAKLDPTDHTQPALAPHWRTQGASGAKVDESVFPLNPITRPLIIQGIGSDVRTPAALAIRIMSRHDTVQY